MTLEQALDNAINKLESIKRMDSNLIKIEIIIQKGTKSDGNANTYRPTYILSEVGEEHIRI